MAPNCYSFIYLFLFIYFFLGVGGGGVGGGGGGGGAYNTYFVKICSIPNIIMWIITEDGQ